MLKHKVFEVFFTFNRKEMTRFEEFVHSPYFNKHNEVRQLVTYLSAIFPDFSNKKCVVKRIKEKAFSQKGISDSQLALFFTYTRRLLDYFLSIEQVKEETFESKHLLLKALRYKKCYKLYEKQLKKLQENVLQKETKDSLFFYHQYQLADEADYFFNLTDRRVEDPNLELKERNLDYFYMIEKLKDAVEMYIRQDVLRVSYSKRMLEGVLTEIAQNIREYEEVPVLYVYYKLYLMASTKAHRYYQEGLHFMTENVQYFDKEEQKVIYKYFQNYCIEQINDNEESFLPELFKLYKLQLKNELLIEDGFLSEWHYKNIITVGIRLGETAWVYDFIEKFKAQLNPETFENTYRYNLATYYYAVKKYDKVLVLLLRLEYSDLWYNLDAKTLLLGTYYELREDEAMLALTASFQQFLQRNKQMPDLRKKRYYNLFKFTKRAAKLRAEIPFISTEKAKKSIDKLKIDIENASAIVNKIWLKEKVKELERV